MDKLDKFILWYADKIGEKSEEKVAEKLNAMTISQKENLVDEFKKETQFESGGKLVAFVNRFGKGGGCCGNTIKRVMDGEVLENNKTLFPNRISLFQNRMMPLKPRTSADIVKPELKQEPATLLPTRIVLPQVTPNYRKKSLPKKTSLKENPIFNQRTKLYK